MNDKDEKALVQVNSQLAGIEKNIKKLFKEKTPKDVIKQRKGAGGLSFPYVPIDYTLKKLDENFGIFWEFITEDVRKTEKQIIVRGRLVIKSPNGFSISRPGVGRAAIKKYKDNSGIVDEGNDEKAATSDAIKKAASLFGVAADVYYKELEKYEDLNDEELEEDKELKQRAMSRYFAVASERGIDGESAKEKIKTAFNKKHMDELSIPQLEHATGLLEKKYEVVEAGEAPRKIGGTPVRPKTEDPGPVSAGSVQDAEVIDESVVKERVFEEPAPRAYFCQGPKHKETGISVEVDVAGDWCSEQCKRDYWGPEKEDKKAKLENFIKSGGKKES